MTSSTRIWGYPANRTHLKYFKIAKMCQKLPKLAIFRHIFAILGYLRGPLVVKLLHILVEEVISFDLSGLTSKSDKNCLQKWAESDRTMKISIHPSTCVNLHFCHKSENVCSSLVCDEKLLENCWKCDILQEWRTFHNCFHNLNLTLSCLHNAKQEWKAWKLHLILSPYKTLGTQTPILWLNLFDYFWRVLQIQLHSHTSSLPVWQKLLHYQHFFEGRPQSSWQLKGMKSICFSLSLLIHMYVLARNYCVSKVLFSLLICMYWPSKTRKPSQSEIFCLIAWTPLAFPLFVWAEREYFTFGGCAGLGRPIHTYEQREQDLGDTIFLANTYIQAERMSFIYVSHANVENVTKWLKITEFGVQGLLFI